MEKLDAALKKFYAFRSMFSPASIEALQQKIPVEQGFKKRFLVKKGVDFCSVKTEEVAYFYAIHKLVCLVDNQGQKFLLDQSLADIEKLLNPQQFFRLNRKYLVQLSAIRRVMTYPKGKLQVELGPAVEEAVMVSAETTAAFKNWMNQ